MSGRAEHGRERLDGAPRANASRANASRANASHEQAQHEQRRLELEEELRWMRAMRRRDNLKMLAGIVASLVVSIPMMAMSAHVTSVEEGRVWLYAGLVLGDAGVLASVGWGLWRSVERGETQW